MKINDHEYKNYRKKWIYARYKDDIDLLNRILQELDFSNYELETLVSELNETYTGNYYLKNQKIEKRTSTQGFLPFCTRVID